MSPPINVIVRNRRCTAANKVCEQKQLCASAFKHVPVSHFGFVRCRDDARTFDLLTMKSMPRGCVPSENIPSGPGKYSAI